MRLYTVERGHDLVDRINQLSAEFVPRVEVDRAEEHAGRPRAASRLEPRAVAGADANLTQVLRLDPRAVLVPLEHDHTQVTLIDPARPLDELMPIALTNRPEVASRRALIQAAEYGVRMEKARPFIPQVLLNGFQTPYEMIQAGIFGLGPNSSLNQWKGRFDFSIQPLWQLQNMGAGNLAAIKGMRGLESMAIIDFFKSQDMAAADVTRALHGPVQSAAARVARRPTAPSVRASSRSLPTSSTTVQAALRSEMVKLSVSAAVTKRQKRRPIGEASDLRDSETQGR